MAKSLTLKQKKANLELTKEHLKNNKVVTINRDAVIDLPVDYLSETLNYIMSSHDQEKVLEVVNHIQNKFKDLAEDAPYDPLLNSVWTLMTLINEINHQAAEQGHTIATEEKIDESVADMLNQMQNSADPVALEKAYMKNINNYKEQIPGDIVLNDELETKTPNED